MIPASYTQKSKITIFIIMLLFLISVLGCEAFVRKFTRKPKRDKLPKEEMVLEPEEYKGPDLTKDELYRQYFLYWKSWQDELIESLSLNANHKKQIDCANEAIKNLENLRPLLSPEKRKNLDAYIDEMNGLKDLITKDIYGNNVARNRLTCERLKRKILRDFSYNKVKEHLI